VQVLYEQCAGIDVHKDQVTVAVRCPGPGPGGRETKVRKFGACYGVLREMAPWLASQGVTHVAMEATGIYTMPVFHALLEAGAFEQVLVCNAAHVKNVPGRKTDLLTELDGIAAGHGVARHAGICSAEMTSCVIAAVVGVDLSPVRSRKRKRRAAPLTHRLLVDAFQTPASRGAAGPAPGRQR
jgi:hypothetical protein